MSMGSALVYSAGIDPAIQDHLRFGLPAAEFVSLLVTTLSRHGRLTDGRTALLAVLEAAKQFLGRDAQAQCDALMQAFPLHL